MTNYLTADQILGADDLPYEDVVVPEWPDPEGNPGLVQVRGLTGVERDRLEFQMAAARKDGGGDLPDAGFRAATVGRCVVDGDGKRVFTDKQLAKLAGKSGAGLDRVFEVVSRLSGMGEDSSKKADADFSNAPS